MERNIIFLYSGRISPKDIKTTTIGDMVSLMKVSKMDAFSLSLVQKHSNLAYIYIYIYIYIYYIYIYIYIIYIYIYYIYVYYIYSPINWIYWHSKAAIHSGVEGMWGYLHNYTIVICVWDFVKKIKLHGWRCRYLKKEVTNIRMESVSKHSTAIASAFYVT